MERRSYTKEEKAEHVKSGNDSGLTVRKYAENSGIGTAGGNKSAGSCSGNRTDNNTQKRTGNLRPGKPAEPHTGSAGTDMKFDFSQTRIYVRPGATDLRKAATGLSYIIRDEMKRRPLSGNAFIAFSLIF